ncbi:hypothetical protein LCGC14_1633450 [marine sediment metagenome]|uniref:Uncharacterized protein n=1 Tax=marine sediment metagenome TaxID=412755 RepID=A0A0F9IP92_9ZZZZ
MTPEECIWHTKTKHRFTLGGLASIVLGMVLACFGGEHQAFLYVGIPIMLGGFGSLIYGMKDDD